MPNKQVVKAYCDMDEDEGGWMLVFAYNHKPKKPTQESGGKLPTDPYKGNSHINLKDLG